MKIKRYRHHKINTGPGTYESLDIGASVEYDTEVDGNVDGDDEDFPEVIRDYLDETLDTLLDSEVDRALELPDIIQESHIWDFYKKG